MQPLPSPSSGAGGSKGIRHGVTPAFSSGMTKLTQLPRPWAPSHTLSLPPMYTWAFCVGRGAIEELEFSPSPCRPPLPNSYTWGPLVAHSLFCTCPCLASAAPSTSGTSYALCLEPFPLSWLMPTLLLWRSHPMSLHLPLPLPHTRVQFRNVHVDLGALEAPHPVQRRRKGTPSIEQGHTCVLAGSTKVSRS